MIRNVVGYEGRYVVDDEGNVFSVKSNRYLASVKMESGYLYVHLHKGDGNSKLKRVHRIVADAFIDNPRHYEQVNHINGDKTDNRVANLEWVTREQNMKHAIDNGLFITSGENNPSAKLNWEKVQRIREEYKRGDKECGTNGLSRKYGVTGMMIGKIVRHECWRDGFSADRSNERYEHD